MTDPHLVYDLRAKLDAMGHYDDNEVNRVANVEISPRATQKELAAAISPVADRMLRRYKELRRTVLATQGAGHASAEKDARDEMKALELFKRNIGAFNRVYSFLSQIFDYGNTDIEKRSIFFRRLLPLLEFGRERDEVDLSSVVLTHHQLKNTGKRNLMLGDGDAGDKLQPLTESGSGDVQDKIKALLAQIISKVNELFEGELTDDDKLIYVNSVIKGKLLESEILREQAANNTKKQFGNSPDLLNEILSAVMSAFDAHTTMSKQALESEKVRHGLRDILLDHAGLYEELRGRANHRPMPSDLA